MGKWRDRVLLEGRYARITGFSCHKDGILRVQFEPLKEREDEIVSFSPPTNSSFGGGPKTKDPYEAKFTYLGESKVPGAGEGVFARRKIPKNRVACPYVGYVYRNLDERVIYGQRYLQNASLSKAERRWAKKYSIGLSTDSMIEIPIEMDSPGVWHPTLGPKVNTDFAERDMNCVYAVMEHPRWGLIQGVHATKDIEEGQELFTDYGYKEGEFPGDHLWYHEAKREMFKEMKKRREQKENNKKKKKKSKKKII